METIRYALISKQDLRIGSGKFEVQLADGRKVLLDELNISDLVTPLTKDIDADAFWIVDLGGIAIGSTDKTVAPLLAAVEDSRTNTVKIVGVFRATTSGTPAASIGSSVKLQAESADENPSDLVELQGVFTDVSAGSEDSDLRVFLRAAGAALAERMRLASSGELVLGTMGAPGGTGLLEMNSTTKGLLPPRMTTAQRDAISTPAAGLIVYNTTTSAMNLYTGSAWVELSTATPGSYAARGITGANNGATPDTKFDLSADSVILRNSNNNVVVRHNPGSITNDTGTAGPAANGRDQSGAFSADSWIHFYWIWDGTTLATISSVVAPPTGPTLPTGYTHWAYAGAVRYNASPILVKTRFRGAWAFYEAEQAALTGGVATVETAVSLANYIPPNALQAQLQCLALADSASGAIARLRLVTGTNYTVLVDGTAAGASVRTRPVVRVPNISQQVFYIWSAAPALGLDVNVGGYEMPNGSE